MISNMSSDSVQKFKDDERNFTPGPWRWDAGGKWGMWLVTEEKAAPILTGNIACTNPDDAPLIAAAREMYEALKKCYLLPRPWLDGGVTWPDWNNAIEDIQAVLSKAEGRS